MLPQWKSMPKSLNFLITLLVKKKIFSLKRANSGEHNLFLRFQDKVKIKDQFLVQLKHLCHVRNIRTSQ
jgi:hypothetical protein